MAKSEQKQAKVPNFLLFAFNRVKYDDRPVAVTWFRLDHVVWQQSWKETNRKKTSVISNDENQTAINKRRNSFKQIKMHKRKSVSAPGLFIVEN